MFRTLRSGLLLLALTLVLGTGISSLAATKITVWGWKAAMDVVRQVLPDFLAAYPDIEVEIVEISPADVYQNLPIALSAGVGAPDVSLIENSHLSQFVDLGGLLDITDRVQPYMEVMNDYKWADARDAAGRIYALPWDSGPVVTYYRRDIFEAAGLPSDPEAVNELISTWEQFYAVCQAIVAQTGHMCLPLNKANANNDYRLLEMILWQRGLGYIDPATGAVTIDSPEAIATLEFVGRFWENNLVSDEQAWTEGWYNGFAATDQSAVATFTEASWMGVFLKTWIAPGTSGLWGVARMPAWEEGGVRAANDGGSAFAITNQGPNPDAAWTFIEFLLARNESQLKMFAYSDFLPSLETTYSDPLFYEADPFFGGQPARLVYAQVVQQIPVAGIYTPEYNEMNATVSAEVQAFAAGQKTAAQALQDAAQRIRDLTGRP
ncbi:MAG: sugar ABC transporter substrate-binding protein [Deinococcus sp.]|nr:sugar ABC transporter substrate-binding protein [Deinococcus sp.]